MRRLLLALAAILLASSAWATAPTYVQEAETVWNTTTTPKDTASFAVLTGDMLVAFAVGADPTGFVLSAPTTFSGSTSAWTAIQSSPSAPASNTVVGIWWATASADGNVVVRFARTGATPQLFGGNVLTFRGSDGIGNSSRTNASGAPTLDITTALSDSAVVVIAGDWAAVAGAETWRANAGAATPASYLNGDGATYAVHGAYHANAGAAALYAVGLTAPAGETYNIMAVEVKGIGGIPAPWTRVGTFAVGNDGTAGSTYAPVTSAALEVGNVGVCVIGKDETGTGTTDGAANAQFTSATDAAGNTWFEFGEWCNMQTSTAADGACTAIYVTAATTQLNSGAAITFTFSASTTRKAIKCEEFSIPSGYIVSITAGSNGLAADGADPASMTVATGVAQLHLFIRSDSCESNDTTSTADADYVTFGGSDTTATSNSGTAATSMGSRGESRIATESTSAASDPTHATADCASLMVGLNSTAPAGTGSGWSSWW